jgi:hypothetical protein
MAPAGFEPARPRVSVGSSARLSYEAKGVAGRNRTCGAPRFRRALYRLSYGHKSKRRLADHTRSDPPSGGSGGWSCAAAPALLQREWARPDSNQRPLVCKTSALPVELLARERLRDKDSNLDRHVQSVVSCRLDDPGTTNRASPSISHRMGDRRTGAGLSFLARRRPRCRTMLSMPLAYPSTLDRLSRACAGA